MNDDALALARDLLAEIGFDDSRPTLSPIHGGRSGALTFRVEVGCRRFALRVQPEERFTKHFSQLAKLQSLAGEAGLAPLVLAVDPERRAMLSEYIAATPLLGALQSPSRCSLLGHLGRQLAGLHALPHPASLADRCPTERTREVIGELSVAGPAFVVRAASRVREIPPAPRRAICHLDLNPTNILFDGQRVRFVDWETAAIGDPAFDLATLINLLLLDPPSRGALLEGYAALAEPPTTEQLELARRHVYLGYGAEFLRLANAPAPEWAIDELPTIAQAYGEIGAGRLNMASTEGQWRLGAAYLGELFRMPEL